MLALIEYIKRMDEFMRDKEQKVKYIDGRWCDSAINESYLNNGWYVVMLVPATTETQTGAYVVLEREKEPEIPEDLIDTFTKIGITLYDNKGKIKSLYQILKEISQRWGEARFWNLQESKKKD